MMAWYHTMINISIVIIFFMILGFLLAARIKEFLNNLKNKSDDGGKQNERSTMDRCVFFNGYSNGFSNMGNAQSNENPRRSQRKQRNRRF